MPVREVSTITKCLGRISIVHNHFSLIKFYHSVCLDFELFGLRAQVHNQLVQFTLARKGYDNHHCHNKPLVRKWGWSVDDIMPGKDAPENLRILKKSQLRLDHGCRKLNYLPLRHVVGFFGSLPTEILNTTRCTARWDEVSIVRIVSLSSCRHEPKSRS